MIDKKAVESIWIAIAIALTNATQARLPGLPIGIGELMILMWLIFLLRKILISKYHFMTNIVKVNFWFWLSAFTFLSLGLLAADVMDLKASGIERDLLAFLLMAFISIGLSVSENFYHEIQKTIFYFLSFSLSILLIIFLSPLTPFLSPWYGGVRFAGWAENPNQLALLLSVIPFLTLHLIIFSKKTILNIWYSFLIIICLILGRATNSDALLVSWIVGFGTLIYLTALKFSIKIFSSTVRIYKKDVLQNFLGMIFVIISIIIVNIVYQTIASSSANVYDVSQGSERVTLWKNGITAMLHSPIFGLGPGAHSGEAGPFLNFEAHNTFIDWGANTGIIGLVTYISLLTWIAWKALQQKYIFLFVSVISLAGFSTFHYVLRHPIFWFYLQTIMILTQKPSQPLHPSYPNSP